MELWYVASQLISISLIESFKETHHYIKSDAITHINPLRRNPIKAERHSMIIFSKYPEELNT
jgi:hypothetical protein